MARGRTSWLASVAAAERNAIHARIDSVADESAKEIFDELNLVRFTKLGTFQKYVYERRRERDWNEQRNSTAEGGCSASSASQSSSPADLLERVLESMADAVAAGTVPAYAMPGYVMSIAKLREVAVREDADRRAAALHEVKLAELRRKQSAAVDSLAQSGTLSADQVAEIRSKVLGL